jgi:hypothetical protein
MAPVRTLNPQQTVLLRRIVITTFRVMLTAAVILTLLTPVPGLPDARIQTQLALAAYMLAWIVIFLLVFRWQIRRVARAVHPQTAMVEAIAVIFVLFVGVFAKCYHMLSLVNPATFTEPLTFFSSVYFSLTILATVGFGDITPVTDTARMLTMIQMVLDLILLGVAVRVVSGAATRRAGNSDAASPPPGDQPSGETADSAADSRSA